LVIDLDQNFIIFFLTTHKENNNILPTMTTFYTPNTYPYNANDPNDIVYRGDRAGVTQMYSPFQCGGANAENGSSQSQFWFLGTRRPDCQGMAVPLNCSAPDNMRAGGSGNSTCQPQQRACATMYAKPW